MSADAAQRVAFVTGASRGIGKASAIALARAGFDVVVTARTVHEGHAADGSSLPGSIETTAEAVRAEGREALAARLDLLDRASIDAALDETLSRFGRIDLLLNNGIYTGEVTMQHVLDIEHEEIERLFEANVFAQLHLVQRVLPRMIQDGGGTIIDMVSAAGMSDPPAPAGRGGWGFAYSASKAAFQRLVGVLAVEHRDAGLRLFNVEPGFVVTEAMVHHDPDGHFEQFGGAPPSVPAAVIAWLASSPDADELSGQTISAQRLALERGLHEDWRPKTRAR
jgi:NAD(P)-dependent dehydrogenase (short-subunit alcohol dehydrogenase family)